MGRRYCRGVELQRIGRSCSRITDDGRVARRGSTYVGQYGHRGWWKIRKSGEERKPAAATASATGQLVGLPNSAHASQPASQPVSTQWTVCIVGRPDGRETDFARAFPAVVDVFCAVIPVFPVIAIFCARVVVAVQLQLQPLLRTLCTFPLFGVATGESSNKSSDNT